MLPKPMQRALCILLVVVFMCTCGCAASTQNTPETTNTESTAMPERTATPENTPVATPTPTSVFPTPDFSWFGIIGEAPFRKSGPEPLEIVSRTIYDSYLIIRGKYIEDVEPRIEFLELIVGDPQAADWIQAEILDKYCEIKHVQCMDGEEYVFCIGIRPEVSPQPMNRFWILGSAYVHIKPDGQLAFFNNYSKEKDIGLKTMDDLKRYIAMIRPLDKSGDSKNLLIEPTGILEKAVAFSTHVVRGTVLQISGVYEGYVDITLGIKDVLKGNINQSEWNIRILTTQVKAGEEYLFLVNELDWISRPDWRPHSAATKNGTIPITDTEMVNEVYGLLGKQWL